ncbi:MAG: selenobiotic family peptide radical SAM maturase [Desulfobulbus sp.]|nr:MAG: selenobiotic family peptide radical SAM maturase [Desulfobulbus sp.]
MSDHTPSFVDVYPVCSSLLSGDLPPVDVQQLPQYLTQHPDICKQAPYLADLAVIERSCHRLRTDPPSIPRNVEQRMVNPTLECITVAWSGLPELLTDEQRKPEPGSGHVLVYRKPDTDEIIVIEASGHDLLALKLIVDSIPSRQAADEGGVPVGVVDDILYSAVHRGLLLTPKSKLIRGPDFPRGVFTDPDRFSTPTFTLQWHITQVCDLHCRHCYDRSDRKTLELDEAIRVLDDLYDFCTDNNVFTQVTFTGGNPLLYPHFNELYKEAADRGFLTAVLGNPMPRHRIEEMLAIQKPEFYQVSLEGLAEHNDYIRGQGHFERILDFLDLLAELDIYSMVMLTLTRANMGEVLELAEILRDRADLFTFNRLAMVGEGADLASVRPEDFPAFLERYMEAATNNPCMRLKDNFFNLVRHKKAMPYIGGCAGYGCGAAFNFVSLLPDGEVHACRKLPSPIGNICSQTFADIYHSEIARKYRAGSSACKDCEIRPVCGGCPAVSYGFGKDIFTELDPYCFR